MRQAAVMAARKGVAGAGPVAKWRTASTVVMAETAPAGRGLDMEGSQRTGWLMNCAMISENVTNKILKNDRRNEQFTKRCR
jgi:hypothetical protein